MYRPKERPEDSYNSKLMDFLGDFEICLLYIGNTA